MVLQCPFQSFETEFDYARYLLPRTIKGRHCINLNFFEDFKSNPLFYFVSMCITRDTVYSFVCHTQRTIQTCFYCLWCLLSVKPYTLGSSFVYLHFPCICGGKLWRWCSPRRCVTPVGFRPGDSWPFITNSRSRTQACSVSHVSHLHSSHVALALPGTGMTFCVSVCVDVDNELSV